MSNTDSKKGLLLSDFTIDIFRGMLENNTTEPNVALEVAPYDQVLQVMLDSNHSCWKQKYDFAVIWTLPNKAIGLFKNLMEFNIIDKESILSEVDEYASLIENLCGKVNNIFIPTWVLPSYFRGYGVADLKFDTGINSILMQMNLRLIERFKDSDNIFLLDAAKWMANVGEKAFNPKSYYMGKIPFSNTVFKEAVSDVKACLRGIYGMSKKIIIVDLDDTLWGGIVGDDGWENLTLGGHDAKGEAFVDFQNALKSFTRRGILLGIVSKNEESIALEAIEKHPEMVLKKDDFVAWRINWQDKAKNIDDLVDSINLGLQSVVFLDDNPVERKRVKDMLPEVFVPDLPKDKMLYTKLLYDLDCFDTPSISAEDKNRTKMYISENERKQARKKIASVEEWLESLETVVTIQSVNQSNIDRTCQLLNKTNQMNLSTRRLTLDELTSWIDGEKTWFKTFSVSDKFGDSGLTGIISLEIEGDVAIIRDFILSCRVMGRKIEEIMVNQAFEYAKSNEIHTVVAEYKPTPKNKPCLDFWKSSGFDYNEGDNTFSIGTDGNYEYFQSAKIISQD